MNHADFYLDVAPQQSLSQGDIFWDFPVIVPILDPVHELVSRGSGMYQHAPVEAFHPSVNILATVEEVSPVMLLSQTCDAQDAARLLLAPLRLFDPSDPQPAKLWGQINELANTLCRPTEIYMPDDPKFGFPRQVLDLESPIAIRRLELERLAREGRRRATLGPDGLGYLQFRLTLLFSRFARDDFAWPSKRDLVEKKGSLEKKIENVDKKIITARGRINSPKLSPAEVENSRAELDRLQAQKRTAQENLRLTEEAIKRHGERGEANSQAGNTQGE